MHIDGISIMLFYCFLEQIKSYLKTPINDSMRFQQIIDKSLGLNSFYTVVLPVFD